MNLLIVVFNKNEPPQQLNVTFKLSTKTLMLILILIFHDIYNNMFYFYQDGFVKMHKNGPNG